MFRSLSGYGSSTYLLLAWGWQSKLAKMDRTDCGSLLEGLKEVCFTLERMRIASEGSMDMDNARLWLLDFLFMTRYVIYSSCQKRTQMALHCWYIRSLCVLPLMSKGTLCVWIRLGLVCHINTIIFQKWPNKSVILISLLYLCLLSDDSLVY